MAFTVQRESITFPSLLSSLSEFTLNSFLLAVLLNLFNNLNDLSVRNMQTFLTFLRKGGNRKDKLASSQPCAKSD